MDWAASLRVHAREAGGRYGPMNLVPKVDVDLWQTAPHVPFDQLVSQDAKGRLSVCKLEGALREGGYVDGRAMYAHVAGETSFWRRNPHQIAGTLAFMLGKDDGSFLKLHASEVPVLREVLTWLKQHNPHLRRFWSNA